MIGLGSLQALSAAALSAMVTLTINRAGYQNSSIWHDSYSTVSWCNVKWNTVSKRLSPNLPKWKRYYCNNTATLGLLWVLLLFFFVKLLSHKNQAIFEAFAISQSTELEFCRHRTPTDTVACAAADKNTNVSYQPVTSWLHRMPKFH